MFEQCKNFADLKKAYRQEARKAHPDMGGCTEAMQRVNAAFEAATKRIERTGERFDNTNAAGAQNAAERTENTAERAHTTTAADMAKFAEILQKIIWLDGIEVEIVGSWIWAEGETYTHRETLKAAGMRYSSKHKAWYWHDAEEHCRRSRKSDTLDDIKARHGCETVRGRRPHQIGER